MPPSFPNRRSSSMTVGKARKARVATGRNAQCTTTIELRSVTVIQRLVARLQPDLIALGILWWRSFQFRQGGYMIVGEVPDFPAIQIGLRPKITVEPAVRCHGRIDEQCLEAMALGAVRRIVAAKRAYRKSPRPNSNH